MPTLRADCNWSAIHDGWKGKRTGVCVRRNAAVVSLRAGLSGCSGREKWAQWASSNGIIDVMAVAMGLHCLVGCGKSSYPSPMSSSRLR